MSFEDVLEGFRDDEKQACVLHLSNKRSLLMTIAWETVDRVTVLSRKKPPASKKDRWVWLWSQVSFSIEDWARAAAIALPRAKAIAHSLIANRVIYPDGTINDFASAYLDNQTEAMLDG